MEVTLKIKDNLYKETPDGKFKKLIKRNVVTYINIDANDIITIGDLLGSKGQILKDYCRIIIKEAGPVIVNHSRQYISNIKQIKSTQIGFKQRNRR